MILEQLECHHIKCLGDEYRAALPSGDNPTAVRVNAETCSVRVYTRNDFPKDKADIITLVEYLKKIYFSKAMYWLCEICGYDYYYTYKEEEIDPCVAFLKNVEPKEEKLDTDIELIDEKVLDLYLKYPNIWFYNDGISIKTQEEFELGFSMTDQRITIPIRDELGNLVGVKGRTSSPNYKELGIPKYLYLFSAPKSLLLFGLDKTYSYIKEANEVIVFESEKSVMQAWSMGFKNCISIGGHELSVVQVMKLEKLGVPIVLAYDKDITVQQIKHEASKFVVKPIYGIYDTSNLLQDKDSPTDQGKEVWEKLYQQHKYPIYK